MNKKIVTTDSNESNNLDLNILDAFESLIYHDLMNQLTFVAFPVDSINPTESIRFSQFSGYQIIHFLQSIRYIKLFEKNELTIYNNAISFTQSISEVINNFGIVLEKKNQRIEFSADSEYMILTDRQLLENLLYNIFSISIKYAPEKSVIKTTVSDVGNSFEIEINYSLSSMGSFANDNNYRDFKTTLLTNSGFERSIAVKLLCCNYISQLFGSPLKITSYEKNSSFIFRINKYIPVSKTANLSGQDAFSFEFTESTKNEIIPLIVKLKATELYKISQIYWLIDKIESICPGGSAGIWSQTAKQIIESGNPDSLKQFLDYSLEKLKS